MQPATVQPALVAPHPRRGYALPVVVAVALLCACTTIHVHNAEVVETQHRGLVVLNVLPGRDSASLIVTTGIGLTFGLNSTTLGYLGETVFIAPDAGVCKAFIVVNDREQLDELRRFFERQPQLAQICVVRKGGDP